MPSALALSSTGTAYVRGDSKECNSWECFILCSRTILSTWRGGVYNSVYEGEWCGGGVCLRLAFILAGKAGKALIVQADGDAGGDEMVDEMAEEPEEAVRAAGLFYRRHAGHGEGEGVRGEERR